MLYNGPLNPKPMCRRTYKDALSTVNDWVYIDGILKAILEA